MADTERIESLDTVRGVAVLLILPMNIVAFAFGSAGYFNVASTAPQSAAAWAVGALGEVLVDQKFMAIFSMLFGAGIVLFSERAEAAGRPWWIPLRRNAILLLIGVLHTLVWDGDILLVYGLCALPLLLLRRRPTPWLLALAALLLVATMVGAAVVQTRVDAGRASLGDYWGEAGPMSEAVAGWVFLDGVARALALMLIGVVAYRNGFLRGTMRSSTYRRFLVGAGSVGLGLATVGYAMTAAADFAPEVALVGTIPNTLGTVPLALAFVAAIVLWQRRAGGTAALGRIQAVGRMALTNYLAQTVLGVAAGIGLAPLEPDRVALLLVVLVIWALQLWWSTAWLARHRYGPAEWIWRWATYGCRPQLRRAAR